jgi:hypothetical protein
VIEERDLWVILKDDMRVASNCQQAYTKASRMLVIMARTIKFRKPEILIRLYKSLVRPGILRICMVAIMSRTVSCWRGFSTGLVKWCRG